MTLNENVENGPWWETELPAVKEKLTVYLRSRVPGLRNDHDDLINDTLLALTQYIQQSQWVPQSWSNTKRPVRDERYHLHRLAMVILKRRVADRFRGRLVRQNQLLDTLNDDVPDSGAVGPERRLIMKERQVKLQKVLAVIDSALDQMPSEDRDLIALTAQGVASRGALSDRERQRLSRIRKRLKTQIARRLGYEIADLLKADY